MILGGSKALEGRGGAEVDVTWSLVKLLLEACTLPALAVIAENLALPSRGQVAQTFLSAHRSCCPSTFSSSFGSGQIFGARTRKLGFAIFQESTGTFRLSSNMRRRFLICEGNSFVGRALVRP